MSTPDPDVLARLTAVEERLAQAEAALTALGDWRRTTVDPGLGQAAQAITTLDRRVTKVVNLLKRVGPAVKDMLGIVSSEASRQDAKLPREERKRRAKTREEVLGSDFDLNDTGAGNR